MPLETCPYDTAEHLRTEEEIALYIEAVLEDGDPALVRDTIGIVARARAITQVADELGLAREAVFRMVAGGDDAGADSALRVLKALGQQRMRAPAVAPAH